MSFSSKNLLLFSFFVLSQSCSFSKKSSYIPSNYINASSHFELLTINDIHLGNKKKMDLNPSREEVLNDLDLSNFQIFLDQISKLIQTKKTQVDTALILGDLVNHEDGKNGSPKQIASQLSKSFKDLYTTFHRDLKIPMAYVFGNNDSLARNYQAFYNASIKYPHSPYDIAKKEGFRSGFLTSEGLCLPTPTQFPCLLKGQARYGYYSAYIQDHLRLIALNTIMFESSHASTYRGKGKHYDGEMQWFLTAMQEAAEARDSVLIAMHMPPGEDFFKNRPMWTKESEGLFFKTIAHFPNVHVVAILAAHTHYNELRIITDRKKSRIIPLLLSPSLSTAHGNAPGFNTYSFQRTHHRWVLKNFQSYGFIRNHFQHIMDFQNAYCPKKHFQNVENCLALYNTEKATTPLWHIMNRYHLVGNPKNKNQMPGRLKSGKLRIVF